MEDKNMKVLFATTNPAKIKKYSGRLKENGIEVLTLKDIDFNINIEENGKNALENAYIKAKTAFDATKIIITFLLRNYLRTNSQVHM